MRNFLEKYLFISDDTVELQMFQGCQNWSWISRGVLGSDFIALPEKKVGGQSSCKYFIFYLLSMTYGPEIWR